MSDTMVAAIVSAVISAFGVIVSVVVSNRQTRQQTKQTEALLKQIALMESQTKSENYARHQRAMKPLMNLAAKITSASTIPDSEEKRKVLAGEWEEQIKMLILAGYDKRSLHMVNSAMKKYLRLLRDYIEGRVSRTDLDRARLQTFSRVDILARNIVALSAD